MIYLLIALQLFTLGFTADDLDTGCDGLPDENFNFFDCMNQDVDMGSTAVDKAKASVHNALDMGSTDAGD